jgi:hypothetical protein
MQRWERRAEGAGARARATTLGGGTSNSAINAATALTNHRFMSSHLRPGSEPQVNASMERNRLPWRDGNNCRNSGVE